MSGEGVQRLRLTVRGLVQGVGFRPFIYRLATELGLNGWVRNSAQGVFIEIEGNPDSLKNFLLRLEGERPPRSSIQSLESAWLDPRGYSGFEVQESVASGEKTALVLPDIATCPDCRAEIFDPANRRYRYPFTNCTNCGPRFTIIKALPYDRGHTTMASFAMCPECLKEYGDPRDRRFHAQPNACPVCGPQLELWDPEGRVLASKEAALKGAVQALKNGEIVAVKGIGGFHLMVDAAREEAVARLRFHKGREEKPFALMYPDLNRVRVHCEVSDLEERLLLSAEAPIVLLRRRAPGASGYPEVAANVAPGNPYLGIMLPYSPLHHLLLAELKLPVVATSGNVADEPLCTDEHEALTRLAGIAPIFLVHNRPIFRHVDDSIVRVVMGRELVLRRARGYAPLPITLKAAVPPILAVGAHLKNSVALALGREVFLSQHIGDLETTAALEAFKRVAAELGGLYDAAPAAVAADLHPDYLSTRFAESSGLPLKRVQHHYAHVLSCMAENELEGELLGVSWDGTGYGADGTVWGGEFLVITGDSFRRVAHFRTFRLPGGEKAVREPRRAAAGLLYEVFGENFRELTDLPCLKAFSARELRILTRMLERNINSPLTSSAGRLFDGVAALTGVRQISRFEGQAAMELEFALEGVETEEAYPIKAVEDNSILILDWEPLVREIIKDVGRSLAAGEMAAKFHRALAEFIVAAARFAGEERVALSGGCFQNRYLTERAVERLRAEGFKPYWHQRVPPNDGGIALGQVVAAAREEIKE